MNIKINWKTISTVIAIASSIAAGSYATGSTLASTGEKTSTLETEIKEIKVQVRTNGENIAKIIGYLKIQ